MIDRAKVIKAWTIFRDSNPYEICSGREFRAIREPEYCMGEMIEDTITLLKEQKLLGFNDRKWQYLNNAEEIIQRFTRCKSNCDSEYSLCKEFWIAANNLLYLTQELMGLMKIKENNIEQKKVIEHINELLAEDCFDGYADTENVKQVLREVLELLNVQFCGAIN